MRAVLALLLLAGCAHYDEEREVVFPKGEPVACDRPEPRPALAKGGSLLRSRSFRRQGHKRALETARLADGVYLQVLHRACGPESQTFRFHLPKGEPPVEGAAAYALAARLLRGAAAPGDSGAALRELASALDSGSAKPLGALIPMGEFQELFLTRYSLPERSVYGWVLAVTYRLKI